jgi:hypothetical protein
VPVENICCRTLYTIVHIMPIRIILYCKSMHIITQLFETNLLYSDVKLLEKICKKSYFYKCKCRSTILNKLQLIRVICSFQYLNYLGYVMAVTRFRIHIHICCNKNFQLLHLNLPRINSIYAASFKSTPISYYSSLL